jgi:ribonuclease HI
VLRVFCDGSIVGGHWGKKTGPKTTPRIYAGWYAQAEDGSLVNHHCWYMGSFETASANVAEYGAVRSALYWLKSNGYSNQALLVHSDSQLVMCQLSGAYNTHEPRLVLLRDHVRELAKTFPRVTYKWIRREENQTADVLSKALQLWDHVPTWDKVQHYLETGKT